MSSLRGMIERVKQIIGYLDAIQKGKVEANNMILNNIQVLLCFDPRDSGNPQPAPEPE